jgi:hypothetical protein
MPIEIKELHIKIKIDEGDNKKFQNEKLDMNKLKGIKSEIIKTCTRNILEILKEKQER